MDPVRILIVADGLEPLLHRTVVGLAERGHEVTVAGLRTGEELDPVDRFRLGSSIRTHCGEPARALRRACRGRRGRRAEVVYFEAAYVAAECAPLLEPLGPKLVMCTGSDVRVMPGENPRLARVLPSVFARMGSILCRSEDLRRHAVALGAPPWRTGVLYPAVDTGFFAPTGRPARRDGALRLVSVGRRHWVKGYEHALQAVALSRCAGHDVTLTIVGPDGGAEESLRFAVADLRLDDVVTFAGLKSAAGVRAALARADAFLLASVSEGVSRATQEAMAMGLPVIATDVGGMSELVRDGVEGLLVGSRDPQALDDAIAQLARDPARRATMGGAARARVREFDDVAHLDRLERILCELAGR